MNDRFKFRVWNKAVKKFIYFNDSELSIDKENMGLLFRSDHLYLGNYEELQQCTGLKDKNGKLIYEGDIVKFNFDTDEIKAVVSWDNKELIGFYLNTTDYFKDKYVTDYDFYKNDYEVIGNIYDNPELLEDTEECQK